MGGQCNCKGVRACALCEHSRTAGQRLNVSRIQRAFVFCPKCSKCIEVDKDTGLLRVPNVAIQVKGISLVEEAISPEDEVHLETHIERTPWVESQSGRRKQDFGPKVNFKKQKVKPEAFVGFPTYMDIVQKSFTTLPSLSDFKPVELCNLKYSPERGSCIDPHFDDCWLWGERLVTLNLSGATVLTFSQAQDFHDLTQTSSPDITSSSNSGTIINNNNSNKSSNGDYSLSTETLLKLSRGHGCEGKTQNAADTGREELPMVNAPKAGDVVHVVLPRRSLIVVEDDARSVWHHSVLREHVQEPRIAMTCRELSETFLDPTNADNFIQGRELLRRATINLEL